MLNKSRTKCLMKPIHSVSLSEPILHPQSTWSSRVSRMFTWRRCCSLPPPNWRNPAISSFTSSGWRSCWCFMDQTWSCRPLHHTKPCWRHYRSQSLPESKASASCKSMDVMVSVVIDYSQCLNMSAMSHVVFTIYMTRLDLSVFSTN